MSAPEGTSSTTTLTMALSYTCGCALIVLSCFILLQLAIMASFFIKQVEVISDLTHGIDGFRCHNVTMVKEIYQHGNYWVLRNYAKGNPRTLPCYMVTAAMQGDYRDIYKLEPQLMGDLFEEPISFAVYIPTERHLQKSLEAIAYVRNCVLKLLTKPNEGINFHLYFRVGQLFHTAFGPNIEQLLANQVSNCTGLIQEIPPDKYVENAEFAQNAIIVGKNIAQESIATKQVFPSDVDTFPSQHLFTNWVAEKLKYVPLEIAKKTDQYIWRLPTFLVRNLTGSEHIGRINFMVLELISKNASRNLFVPNMNQFDKLKWINLNTLNTESKGMVMSFENHLKQFVQHKSYFMSHKRIMPFLNEDRQLTSKQSEQLKLIQFALQDLPFICMHISFVLHNVADNILRPQIEDVHLNTSLVDEYVTIYATKKIELDYIQN